MLPSEAPASISIVIPVFSGATTLPAVVAEIEPYTRPGVTPGGRSFRVTELILVHDGAVDASDQIMEELRARFSFVSLIWLSRNYGQHPATLAGMASTSSEWVVTMDEDGQHDPRCLGEMLDRAVLESAQTVYGIPSNAPPHGPLRNAASGLAKVLFVLLLDPSGLGTFSSFRLVSGEIARSLAAYCGSNVYLDVALSWVVARTARVPVAMRNIGERPSGYTYSRLFTHFWRLVVSSGTRPLRLIALIGSLSILAAGGLAAYALWEKLTQRVPIQGWTSIVIAICLFSGLILFSLGVISEYLGVAINMAMGKPLFLVVSKPVTRSRGT